MFLWIAMAVLAAAACVPLLMALSRAGPRASAPAQAMAIYRDQLDELERDAARGDIAPGEAEAARAEIARRLIRESEATAPAAAPGRRRTAAIAVVVAMPIVALGIYLFLGYPQYPDQPLASRPDAQALRGVRNLVERVEAHLAEKPDDGKGWEVLAPVYQRLGRDDDAVNAWTKAIALLGPTAEREASLGEALMQAAGGSVTADANAAFEKAHALAPDDPRPRFYLALGLSQAGKKDEASAAWQALLHDAPAGASWVPAAQAQLAALEAPAPGPDAGDIAAASNMDPAARQTMIEGMVATLADRLKTEPEDADGWARLIRSYMVLGRTDDARGALASARLALAGDPAKWASVAAAAHDLGLTEESP